MSITALGSSQTCLLPSAAFVDISCVDVLSSVIIREFVCDVTLLQGDASKWRARPDVREARDVEYNEAAYAECYPLQADMGASVVDSDDEDLSHMDAKASKGKSR